MQNLYLLQQQFDAEGHALETARVRPGAPSLIEAWRDVWRAAPRSERRAFARLCLLTPCSGFAFVMLWIMLP